MSAAVYNQVFLHVWTGATQGEQTCQHSKRLHVDSNQDRIGQASSALTIALLRLTTKITVYSTKYTGTLVLSTKQNFICGWPGFNKITTSTDHDHIWNYSNITQNIQNVQDIEWFENNY